HRPRDAGGHPAAPAPPRDHAERGGIPLALRAALALSIPPRPPVRPRRAGERTRVRARLRARRIDRRAVRRQFQLAGADLVPPQLPRDRRAPPPARRPRRRVHGRAPDRLRTARPSRHRGGRPRAPPPPPLPPRRQRPPAPLGVVRALPGGSRLARRAALPRILPRPDRRRTRRLASDGLDGARRGARVLRRSEEHTSELQSLAYLVC